MTRIGYWVFTTVVVALLAGFAPGLANGQTPFVPYFGKNQIRYDNFRWHTYTTDHFEIYYYPEMERHLERVAGYAESAYQHISTTLKHDISGKITLILFKTSSEFQQQNVIPGAAQEGVGAFVDTARSRMLLPIDEPPDLLYRLVVHELGHVFQNDIIPAGLIRQAVPLWVHEGNSDYLAGVWRPIDLMTVRDAAIADIIPKMSQLEGYGNFGSPRLIYNLGHATFEFIEARWGKEGVRQFMFALRKSVIGGGDNAYQDAFKISAEEFDQQFDKYLKDRFKPFRDRERPADYGRNLAPNAEKTQYQEVLSAEPSPSGDLMAQVTLNRKDQELDIVLVSSKDGSVVRNLTSGFNKDLGFEFLIQPGMRYNTVAWMSWAPTGDQLAYIVRTEKHRTLIIQNVLTGKIERRLELKTVDAPESPSFSPDGRQMAFAGLQDAIGDIFTINIESGALTNVSKDAFADSGPTWTPDGQSLIYVARISGNEKLFRLDLDTGKKTQLTFGMHDDAQARFLDADTIVFPSTAIDPGKSVSPEDARNGVTYNIWTLNLQTGELLQYTDAVAGNVGPIVLNRGKTKQIAFITYYKGAYELHALDRKEPLAKAASEDFGAPGQVIDFQSPVSHMLVAANQRKKETFEHMFLDGRPPLNVGITSGGDVFGGSQVVISDVLGDKQFAFSVASVQQYRSMGASYTNLEHRFQYSLQGYSQKEFFYGDLGGVFFDPSLAGLVSRDMAVATRTVQGGTAFGIYPFNKYRRIEAFGGLVHYSEEYNDPELQQFAVDYQRQACNCDQDLFNNGLAAPLGVSFVQETTVFREFGPLAGNTIQATYQFAPSLGANSVSRQTVDGDARLYQRIGSTGLLALRARGFRSWGRDPDYMYFGGNSEMRGYDYLEFIGQRAFFLNAELRFPLIEAMLTPIGILGGIRGVFFADAGGASFAGQPFTFLSRKTDIHTPVSFDRVTQAPINVPPRTISGLRLVDGRASYGVGVQTFLLGFPLHFDWAWRTLFNQEWEDIVFAADGGSEQFRKPRFRMWIGYDF
jgi:hypothetical protein